MGLITKEVEVRLNAKNLQHYIDLGYKIPKYTNKKGELRYKVGTKIIVKVEDLTEGSHVVLDYACDCCDKPLKVVNKTYILHNHNGKYYCNKCAAKLFNSGENNCKWNPYKTNEERENERYYPEYANFIQRVLARDDYTCQCCKKKLSGDAEVHHLDGYHWCVEKRTDDTNGITLCHNCHFNFHSIYGRGNNTVEQFEEWIGHTISKLEIYDGVLPTRRKIYCVEDDCIYDNLDEAIKILGVTKTELVRNVCNHKEGHYTVRGKHLFWLDEYEKISNDDLMKYLKNYEPQGTSVICVNTGEIYNTITKATKDKRIKYVSQISGNCRGKQKSAGKLPDGTRLKWMYYEDFLALSIEEQNKILNRNKDLSNNDRSFII